MSRPRVLWLGLIRFVNSEWQSLANLAELLQVTEGTREMFLSDCRLGVYDGVVSIARTLESKDITGLFDVELVEALPSSVKFLSQESIGYDQIDVVACTQRGISVSNSPGVIGAATADLAMFLMLGALRHAWIPVSSIRAGKWRGEMDIGRDPEDKVLGIIGMGSIGKSVTKKSLAFGMKVQYHNHSDHHPSSTTDIPEEVKWVPWEELLRTSDVISVHVPLSTETRYLLSTKEFALMKDGVTIVNTSRGPVVDELALIDGLESGKLWAAGLDVFEHEPEVHPKLLKSGKVFLLPHLGAGTMETGRKVELMVIDNVKSALQRGALINLVPEQRLHQ